MRLFEASLKADFRVINSIREGSLLESELADINEANERSFKEKIIEFLRLFWEKIKAIFINFKSKLIEYFDKEGKAFVAHFNRSLAKNYKHELSKEIEWQGYNNVSFNRWTIYDIPYLGDDKSFDDYCSYWYALFSGHKFSDYNCDNNKEIFISSIKNKYMINKKVNADNFNDIVSELTLYITGRSTLISDLNTIVKHSNNEIKKLKNILKMILIMIKIILENAICRLAPSRRYYLYINLN